MNEKEIYIYIYIYSHFLPLKIYSMFKVPHSHGWLVISRMDSQQGWNKSFVGKLSSSHYLKKIYNNNNNNNPLPLLKIQVK